MATYRLNDNGPEIAKLCRHLNLFCGYSIPQTSVFDQSLEDAIVDFQSRHALYADGVVGKITAGLLIETYEKNLVAQYGAGNGLVQSTRTPADAVGKGYDNFRLRADVATALSMVKKTLNDAGVRLTSAGGVREISTEATNDAMSASSFHYTGRALDLAVGTGMERPDSDVYVVVSEDGQGRAGNRLHRVLAESDKGVDMEVLPVTYEKPLGASKKVKSKFVDVTAIFEVNGFERIRARPKFFDTSIKASSRYLGAEWWHFQYTAGLLPGFSTFGHELALFWPMDQLERSTPWKKCATFVYGENWN